MNVTDGRTDRQTTVRQDYYGNTALCSKVHRGVKINEMCKGIPWFLADDII